MNDLERDIREALKKQDAKYDAADLSGDEMSFQEMMNSVFRGKMRMWNILTYIFAYLCIALCVFSFTKILSVESVNWQIFWAAISQFFFLNFMGMHIWIWMMMNRNATAREVKRLELRIVELREQLSSKA